MGSLVSLIQFVIYMSTGDIRAFITVVFSLWDFLRAALGSFGFAVDIIEGLLGGLIDFQGGGVEATINKWKEYRDIFPDIAEDITDTVVSVAQMVPTLLKFIPAPWGTIISGCINAIISMFTFRFDNAT